ncbi:MAG: VIT1/CCC1 transporter family protein, partial [Patescibacteria group bacterium]|nr:VIT1/CCC1 transporter family protein [Patescibacteria group bacterium]
NEKAKEFLEIHNHPETQKNASMEILLNKGFTKEQAKTLVDVYATNPSYWVEFVMSHERSLQNPEREKPYVISLMTFLSFIGFGVVPLIPYVLHREHPNVFFLSVIATAGSLFLLGIVRYFVTKQSLLRSIVESLFLGGIAAFIAYMVGRMANIVGL